MNSLLTFFAPPISIFTPSFFNSFKRGSILLYTSAVVIIFLSKFAYTLFAKTPLYLFNFLKLFSIIKLVTLLSSIS